jgi:hypothetical protein
MPRRGASRSKQTQDAAEHYGAVEADGVPRGAFQPPFQLTGERTQLGQRAEIVAGTGDVGDFAGDGCSLTQGDACSERRVIARQHDDALEAHFSQPFHGFPNLSFQRIVDAKNARQAAIDETGTGQA